MSRAAPSTSYPCVIKRLTTPLLTLRGWTILVSNSRLRLWERPSGPPAFHRKLSDWDIARLCAHIRDFVATQPERPWTRGLHSSSIKQHFQVREILDISDLSHARASHRLWPNQESQYMMLSFPRATQVHALVSYVIRDPLRNTTVRWGLLFESARTLLNVFVRSVSRLPFTSGAFVLIRRCNHSIGAPVRQLRSASRTNNSTGNTHSMKTSQYPIKNISIQAKSLLYFKSNVLNPSELSTLLQNKCWVLVLLILSRQQIAASIFFLRAVSSEQVSATQFRKSLRNLENQRERDFRIKYFHINK